MTTEILIRAEVRSDPSVKWMELREGLRRTLDGLTVVHPSMKAVGDLDVIEVTQARQGRPL